jgi:hypothetical protein
MNASLPVRIIADHEANELDRRADEALARFRAQWPAERCKTLRDAIIGTPAEKAAASASFVADALARVSAETPADKAVLGLLSDDQLKAHSRDQRRFVRGGLS